MKILYIYTTTSCLYTGIVVNGKLVEEVQEDLGKDLSSLALERISGMLKKQDLTPQDIDKIIVVNGPGSFTGIRVGVTIAKTYAYSLHKEVTTISSLEAMATSSKKEKAFIIPIIDARRGYVYGAIYNSDLTPTLNQQYLSLETLKCAVDNLIDDYTYISNQEFKDLEVEEYKPDIEKIVNKYFQKESINPHAVNPIYLKQTEAEEKQNVELI